VVASSGTSLTEGQIKLIKRFTDNVTVLYDGDAAGIKASLRGIDLLLEQGLNVRTVSFPDGEDPDSYCKKLGASEFQSYLEKEVKDFVIFKTELLMQGVGNDPIRKTEVVRNLLVSISLIPDTLKRAAYARECSRMMDMDEKMLLVEINKLRKGKGAAGYEVINQEIQEVLQVGVPQPEVYTGGDDQEKHLIRLLIQSGNKKFMEDATVADFVFKELQEDEALRLVNPLYQKVVDELQVRMQESLEFDEHFFINHEDSDIRRLAADFLTEREDQKLSDRWLENGIMIKTERENYVHDLQSLFLFLKKFKVEQMIRNNLEEFENAVEDEQKNVCMDYHRQLIDVRNAISSFLGTVVN